jgi:hypothetical protein
MSQRMISIKIFWVIALIIVQGCTPQSRLLDIEAGKQGFTRKIVQGSEFQHVIYIQHGVKNDSILHVYLDGDGQPWIRNRLIAADPTPVNPLMLELMAMDRTSSIYLGRPCYHGFAAKSPCDPELWTSARYSLRVVKSMEQVLRDFMVQGGYSEVVLIGHSGGGTLAMLLAQHISATSAVVTIAGNLDIDAWTEYHGYTALKGSLNPARMPGLGSAIQQYHLIGKADKNIPYPLIEQALRNQPNAHVLMWDKFDHACCWQDIWAKFLHSLEKTGY